MMRRSPAQKEHTMLCQITIMVMNEDNHQYDAGSKPPTPLLMADMNDGKVSLPPLLPNADSAHITTQNSAAHNINGSIAVPLHGDHIMTQNSAECNSNGSIALPLRSVQPGPPPNPNQVPPVSQPDYNNINRTMGRLAQTPFGVTTCNPERQ
jgi:hypothetical protein